MTLSHTSYIFFIPPDLKEWQIDHYETRIKEAKANGQLDAVEWLEGEAERLKK